MAALQDDYQAARIQALIDDLTRSLSDLPDERRVQLEGELRKIKQGVADFARAPAAGVPGYQDGRRLGRVLRGARSGAWVCDLRARKVSWSPELRDLLGVSAPEAENSLPFFDLIHPDDRAAAVAGIEAAAQKGGSFYQEFRVIRPDGQMLWLNSVAFIEQDESGCPLRITGINQDITERKQAEALLNERNAALRRSEDKFASAFEYNPAAMVIIRSSDGCFTEANESFCDMVGYHREEIVGHTAAELGFYSQALREVVMGKFGEKGYAYQQEIGLMTKSGAQRQVLFSIDPIEATGEASLLVTMMDITERKQAESLLKERNAALRESEARERARGNELEALMDAVPIMIWISHDTQCRVMTSNRAGYDFLGAPPGSNISITPGEEEGVGRQPYQFMKDGQVLSPADLPMQAVASTGRPVREFTFDLVFDAGQTYHLYGNVNPLFDAQGKPAGSIGAFVDVTQLRWLERQQTELRAQMEIHHRLLEQREKDRQAIARDIHDGPVQTLASTLFNLQFAKEAFSDPLLTAELEQIALNVRSATQELRQVIYELRPPSVIRFGLAKAIRFHAGDLRDKVPELKLSLYLADDGDQLSEMACLTMYRIYQEAITNVVRHSGATRAWVRLTAKAGSIALSIRDNGRGLPPENNAENLTQSGHYGLAGIKERVEALNGKLSILSNPAQGTIVKVQAPVSGNQ